jgi:hypothetical protein
MRTRACPRTDCVFVAAVQTIAQLAADGVCLYKKVESLDILGVVKDLLEDFQSMQRQTVTHLIEIVAGLASGVRTTYMHSHLEALREALHRVGRVMPEQYGEKIRETHWVMSKLGISMRDMAEHPSKYFGPESIMVGLGSIGAGLPESPLMRAAAVSDQEEKLDHIDSEYLFFPAMKEYDNTAKDKGDNDGGSKASDQQEVQEVHVEPASHAHTHVHGAPGTYTYCGPTSCGSLRYTDSPHMHGTFSPVHAVHSRPPSKTDKKRVSASKQMSTATKLKSEDFAESYEGFDFDPKLRELPVFDKEKNTFSVSGEYMPPSEHANAEKRMERFMDLYYSNDYKDKGNKSPGDGAVSRSKTVDSKLPALLAGTDPFAELPSPAGKRAIKSVGDPLNSTAPAALDHLAKSKMLATTNPLRAKKTLLRLSVDDIPELLMTKPLKK